MKDNVRVKLVECSFLYLKKRRGGGGGRDHQGEHLELIPRDMFRIRNTYGQYYQLRQDCNALRYRN